MCYCKQKLPEINITITQRKPNDDAISNIESHSTDDLEEAETGKCNPSRMRNMCQSTETSGVSNLSTISDSMPSAAPSCCDKSKRTRNISICTQSSGFSECSDNSEGAYSLGDYDTKRPLLHRSVSTGTESSGFSEISETTSLLPTSQCQQIASTNTDKSDGTILSRDTNGGLPMNSHCRSLPVSVHQPTFYLNGTQPKCKSLACSYNVIEPTKVGVGMDQGTQTVNQCTSACQTEDVLHSIPEEVS